MTDSFITVTAGGPPPDQDIPDGVYPLILTDIKDPRTVTAQRGPNAGQSFDLRDWVFAIDLPGHPLDGRIHEASTSMASGPKSKQYAYLTALKQDLLGRRALGTFQHDEGGWPQIVNLSALPPHMQQQPQAAPAAPSPAPVAATTPVAYPQPAAAPPAQFQPQQIIPPQPQQPVAGSFGQAGPQPSAQAPLRDQVDPRGDLPF
jgi:hypothetical protein